MPAPLGFLIHECTDGGCSWKVRAAGTFSSPGTKDIEVGVDDEGFIFLGYKAEMDDKREFLWRKDYTEPVDTRRAREETKNNGYGYSCVTVWLGLFEFQEICSSRHEQVIKSSSRHAGESLSARVTLCLSPGVSVLFTLKCHLGWSAKNAVYPAKNVWIQRMHIKQVIK